nr:MAG TPA: hypothetical protein [Caudoviricetes sp.]
MLLLSFHLRLLSRSRPVMSRSFSPAVPERRKKNNTQAPPACL